MDWEYWSNLFYDSDIDFKKLGARNLTPNEYEALQTLPIDYTKFGIKDGKVITISDTQRYKVIGNGWTAKVIEYLLKHLKL